MEKLREKFQCKTAFFNLGWILTSQFLHLNCPKIKNTKRNYYQNITNYRVSNLTKPINLKCLKL